jgi:AraC family transcriptional activator of mtrCDE
LLTEPINWLLESLELDASLFHVGRYCGSWHASTNRLARASFHLVVQGRCWLHLGEIAQELSTGDAIFLLRDDPYCLSGHSDAAAARAAMRGELQPLSLSTGDGVGLVCGFFHFQPGLSELIIETLPRWLLLHAGDPALDAARALFKLILEECERSDPSSVVLERLSHLLFLYVLRKQAHADTALGGLVGLARHPTFGKLLAELIAHPGRPWSLDAMASHTGQSRSAFFKRFQEIAGQSPGQVLLHLRIHEASRRLKQGVGVAEVAEHVGYRSIGAFTRAFQKVIGISPGAYRRQPVGAAI